MLEQLLTPDNLAIIWFMILGVLLGGYAMLDGFDLGAGILHPFVAKSDQERRLVLNSIGPLWDGNEVWLITFGGALFAMFPMAYACVFSGFYTAFMLLLFALIFRAVSIEFRSKIHAKKWRQFWDLSFFLSSTCAAFLFGVTIGNIIAGIRLTPEGDFAEGLISQLNPYALFVGLLTLTTFSLHGSIYLYLKNEGELQLRLRKTILTAFGMFLVFYSLTTIASLVWHPHVVENFFRYPVLWSLPVLHVFAIANIPRSLYLERPGYAFVSSCCNICALVAFVGIGIFPYLVRSPEELSNSLTIFNARSSLLTLKIGLLIVLLGMPCVLSYTAMVYWTFRGKVKIGTNSY